MFYSRRTLYNQFLLYLQLLTFLSFKVLENHCAKIGKYIRLHHARFEMFSALVHIVVVSEREYSLHFTIFRDKRIIDSYKRRVGPL